MAYLGNDLSTIVKSGKIAYKFLATSGQTAFTGNDSTGVALELTADSFVNVFLNGVRLIKGDDYTLSYNTLTLVSGAALNDELVIVRDIDNSVYTSYTRTETDTAITSAINTLKGGVGTALDTLNELATALNNDASFASTVTTALGTKANTSSLGTLASKNTIDTTDITNSAITSDKINAGAVTSTKIASGAAVSNIGYTPLNKAGDTIGGAILGSNGRNIINGNGSLNVYDDNSFSARNEYPATNGANGQVVYLGDDQGNAASGYARTYHQLCKHLPGANYSNTYEIWHRGDVNYFYGGRYILRVNAWYTSDRNNFHESVSLRCLGGRRDGIRVHIYNNGQGIWLSSNSSWGYIAVRKIQWEEVRDVGTAYCACENGGPLNGSYINTTLPSGQLATLEADGGYNIRGQYTFNG